MWRSGRKLAGKLLNLINKHLNTPLHLRKNHSFMIFLAHVKVFLFTLRENSNKNIFFNEQIIITDYSTPKDTASVRFFPNDLELTIFLLFFRFF